MTYSDTYNLRTTSVKFNDVADAIDGSITRPFGGTTSGTSTAYAVSPLPAWSAYDNASFITIIPNVTNTVGSPSVTINISGLGTKVIKRGGADLVAGVLVQNIPTILVYVEPYFEVIAAANSLLLDGSSVMLNNLNFGGYKPINIAAGTAASPAICAGNDTDTGFFSPAANQIGIATAGSEKIRIGSSFIGIGNGSPAVLVDAARSANDTLTRIRLHNGNAGSSAQVHLDLGNDQSDSAASIILNSSTNTANAGANSLNILNGLAAKVRVRAGGSGGVDLASGATSWAAVSDIRLKKNVKPLTYGLSKINQLDPVRFDYAEDESEDSQRIGFVAQQVQPVIPEAVTGTQDTYFGVSATELIPVMINAIKELSAKVVLLEQGA